MLKAINLRVENFYRNMKRIVILQVLVFVFSSAMSQVNNPYKQGVSALKNLEAIASVSPYEIGGMGFDDRYEGVRGSPRLFDTLFTSLLRLEGYELPIELKADIDVVNNRLLFIHPRSENLLSIPADMVDELRVTAGDRHLLFRSTAGMLFEKPFDGVRLCRVLLNEKIILIEIASKNFVEADYRRGYGPQRTYDEYEAVSKYYVMTDDGVFRQVTPSRKALTKIFPGREEIILAPENNRSQYSSDEEYLVSVIRKL